MLRRASVMVDPSHTGEQVINHWVRLSSLSMKVTHYSSNSRSNSGGKLPHPQPSRTCSATFD
eukprot:5823853-Prorocentrum_lima.AAC.1